MTWAQNTTTKVWTNTGATRSVVVATSAFPGLSSVSLVCAKPADNVKAIVFASLDGRSCYEAGIEGVNVIVRRTAFGVVGSEVTNGAADVPAAGPCTVAHALPANTPFTMDVRVYAGLVEVRINGTLRLRHTVDVVDYLCVFNPYANQRYYGFVTEVSGAVVSKAEIAPLVQAEPTPLTEVLIAVCDGNIVLSEDGINASTVASGVGAFGNSDLVSLVEYQRKVWGVGTGFAKVFDPEPSTLTTSSWPVTAGSLPASSGAGLTRCTLLENFLDRLVMAGDVTDPQNAFMTAVGDATDFDTSADNEGRAFALGTGLTGRIGQPITCIKQAANGTLVFGCTSQMWRLTGDPSGGSPFLAPASLSSGISGKDAAILADASTLIAHSPDGAFVIGSGPGEPAVNLSAAVLGTGIEIPAADIALYYVIVVRDTARKLTYIFLTPKASGATVHYVYDEQAGGFQPGKGGWFEDQYDPSIGPTAARMFRGELILGTRDGRLLKYSETVTADDGVAFTSRVPLTLLDAKASNHDAVKVEMTSLVLADDSDPVSLRVYRGRTAEEALIGTARSRAWTREVPAYSGEIRQVAKAPALCFELWNESALRGWSLESLEVDYTIERNGARHGWFTPTPYRAPCTLSTSSGGESDDGPGAGEAFAGFVYEDSMTASATALTDESPNPNLESIAFPGQIVPPDDGYGGPEANPVGGIRTVPL